jgi:hypothetical protein
MANASDYLESKIIRAIFKEEAFPTFSAMYIAMHTADPGDTGGDEVTLGEWPSYTRMDAADGQALTNGWTAEANGVTQNALQTIFPVFDGGVDITVTHFSIWDAATNGNMLVSGQLTTSRTISDGDVLVVDSQKLTVQAL